MARELIDRICGLATRPCSLGTADRAEAVIAFEDTMAVALAGWREPVAEAARALCAGGSAPLVDGSSASSAEHAAFVHAVAGHALDYDDVHLVSVTHPSVVIVPALLAVAARSPDLAKRVLPAFAVGVAVNIALGRALGFSHYDKGWHATSTIGPIAGAAALAHLLGLDDTRTRHAVALAAAQCGGLQRNFGAMAKPVQAGNAAAAAVRAALLAERGVTGDDDVFGPRGYFALYGGPVPGEDPASVAVEIDMRSLSRKLYPCCYITHRLIAAALDARRQLPGGAVPASARIDVRVPYGMMRPLHVTDPRSGLEGKFCAAYTIATALHQGSVGLADFEDAAVRRPAIRALMEKTTVTEEELKGEMPIGVDHGEVVLEIGSAAKATVTAYPGSPARPASEAEMTAKLEDCLAFYNRGAAAKLSLRGFRDWLHPRIGLGDRAA